MSHWIERFVAFTMIDNLTISIMLEYRYVLVHVNGKKVNVPSSSHPIPRCWTLRNQFHPISEIPSRWIVADSQKFLSIPEFSSIPTTPTNAESNRFPESLGHTGHSPLTKPSWRRGPTPVRNSGNWRNQFRNVHHRGIGCILTQRLFSLTRSTPQIFRLTEL